MKLTDLITVTAAEIEVTDEFGNVLFEGKCSQVAAAIPEHLGHLIGGIVLDKSKLFVWIMTI